MPYDAFLLVSFGGPEKPDDVMPFLRNVTRGRGVPDDRLAEVAEHYYHFGGVSPINEQCRDLLRAVEAEFGRLGFNLPIYWGNRNWPPMIEDTVREMRDAGVRRAIAFATSGYGSYSSCRQYLEDIARARAAVGADAPVIDKIRHFHDHPGFIAPHVDAVKAALDTVPASSGRASGAGGNSGRASGARGNSRSSTRLVFTAHSIPSRMDDTSGPTGHRYSGQLRETAGLVAAAAAPDLDWDLVWQSRSGSPSVPWLEPDVNDHLAALAKAGVTGVVASPIGFISDHLEVLWDLDNEASETAKELGLDFVRAATPGVDPRFVAMIAELVAERVRPQATPRRALGSIPSWDSCGVDCCPPVRRP